MKQSYNQGKKVSEKLKIYIRKYFQYDQNTGIITRSDRANSNGSYDKDGYLILKIKGCQFKAHRIAWFLHFGRFPKMEIDHINRNKTDNRICNLREADRIINTNNILHHKNKETGVVGIYIDHYTNGLKKIYSTRLNGKTKRFYTLQEAINFRHKNNKIV